MRIPKLPTRPLIAAAAVLAAAVLLTTGIGQTHATEPVNPQVAENSQGGTTIGTPMSATSTAGNVSYSLSGMDATNFTINPSTGEISLAQNVSPDFETKSTYEVKINASTTVTVQVVNLDEPGTVSLSSDEPGAGDTINATLHDPDGSVTNTAWTWSRSADDLWTTIPDANQSAYTTTTADIGHFIRAEVTYHDAIGTGNLVSAATANAVTNDPPVFPNHQETRTVAENAADGAKLGDPITAQDPNSHSVSYSISDSEAFAVGKNDGQIAVQGNNALDYEDKQSHSLTLTATDSHNGTGTTTVVVNVTNVDEAGSVSLAHGLLRDGTTVTASVADPDGSVSGISWQWQRSSTNIDSAIGSSFTATSDDVGHKLTVVATYIDGHGAGKSAQATTASEVGNDAPTFTETSPQRSINENLPVSASVGADVTASDPNNDSITYSLSDDTSFSIDQDGAITSAAVFDYEEDDSHSLDVIATDTHGAADRVTVTIKVNNIDEAGTIALDKPEPKVGDTVTASLTDPDGTTSGHSWQWQHGDGSTWTAIADATTPTYEVQSEDIGKLLQSTVGYTDPQGAGKTAYARTTANVANDPPTFTTTGPVSVNINENNAVGASIGTALQATDPNDDTLTFTIEGTDAASFAIDANGQMTATASLDHESKSSHAFNAKVSDPAGGSDTITVNVTVQNAEEAGTVVIDTETAEVNNAITASLTDPDGSVTSQTWQWQTGESATGPWTDIDDATEAAYTPTADDVDQYLKASVSYTDGHGADTDAASTTAGAVQREPNKAPSFDDATTTFSISINVREGIRVAPPFSATDPNDDTLTYSIVSDTADAFTINSETGEVLMGSADMAVDTTYQATISVTDGMDDDRNADDSADDSLSLTMTMVNPNIVVEPESYHTYPQGLWVNDSIVATTSDGNTEDWVLFYDQETQASLTDQNFEITTPRFAAPKGIWSDGTTLYLLVINEGSNNQRGKIYGYSLANGNRQSSKDINLANANRNPYGLTGRNGRLYVTDSADNKVYAYDIATRSRTSEHDINGIDRMNKLMTDLWLNDETVWVSYWRSDFIRAYDVETGEHQPGLDIQTAAENRGPTGIDSDGFNLWALDQVNDTIYGYIVPR